jgi:hypothetical protein
MVRLTCGEPGFWFQVEGGGHFLATFSNTATGGVRVQEGWGNIDRQIDWEY